MLSWSEILRICREGNPKPERRVVKSEAEWKTVLRPDQYQITRQKGTERPYSSEMCGIFASGIYHCVCCKTVLFDASVKFESGTGWPSFTSPVTDTNVAYHLDQTHGMSRVETLCNVCDAHLGHVFPDGPPPTGLRFCINAVALEKD